MDFSELKTLLSLFTILCFWTEANLTSGEKTAYEELKSSDANLIDKIPESIKSLLYTCLKCNQSSPENKFKGHFREAS